MIDDLGEKIFKTRGRHSSPSVASPVSPKDVKLCDQLCSILASSPLDDDTPPPCPWPGCVKQVPSVCSLVVHIKQVHGGFPDAGNNEDDGEAKVGSSPEKKGENAMKEAMEKMSVKKYTTSRQSDRQMFKKQMNLNTTNVCPDSKSKPKNKQNVKRKPADVLSSSAGRKKSKLL